jgi:hypothetical protein
VTGASQIPLPTDLNRHQPFFSEEEFVLLKKPALAAVLSLFVASACASDPVAPKAVEQKATTPPVVTPPVVDNSVGAIIFFRNDWTRQSYNPPTPVTSVVHFGGMSQTIWAKVLTKSGAVVGNASVEWSTSNPEAIHVAADGNCGPVNGCGRTSIYALATGNATVTATFGGVSASLNVAAYIDVPETNGATLDFSVIELASSSGDEWAYAPQLRITSPTDLNVVAMRYTIPGAATTSLCGSSKHIAAGRELNLFPEIYGDFAIVDGNGKRATGPASITVYLQDGQGNVFKAVKPGTIVPGGMPTTYTGVVIDDPWQVPC